MAENGKTMLARLEEVLDTYGSDRARWPAGERQALERVIAKDAQAARLLGEATALDRMLALAPAGEASPALASRIVAAAVADGSREARVVPITAARPERRTKGGGFSIRSSLMAPAAALLAASFAFGIYLGAEVVDPTGITASFNTAALDTATYDGSNDVAGSLFASPDEAASEQGGLL